MDFSERGKTDLSKEVVRMTIRIEIGKIKIQIVVGWKSLALIAGNFVR
jgi:hypothetical protein